MGLISFVLGKIRRPLGKGFKFGKLLFHCIQAIPRPGPIIEKIAVFLLGLYNTRAALAYCGGRILWNKKRSKDQAARAMEVLASYDLNEDGTVDASEVAVALKVTAPLNDDYDMSRARAGYIFVACLMERMAVDSNIARSYRLPSGRFDAAKCLKHFYASPQKFRMVDAVRQNPDFTTELRNTTFMPIAQGIWESIHTKLRNDLIEMLLL